MAQQSIFGDHLVIDSFRGDYKFLSNFYMKPIVYGEKAKNIGIWDNPQYPVEIGPKSYPSAEHLYQSFKTGDATTHEKIRTASSPGLAKKYGGRCEIRYDWDTKKLGFMKLVIAAKFKDPKMRALLKATGEAKLVEGNTWGDKFWGQVNGKGENWLGKILMIERAKP